MEVSLNKLRVPPISLFAGMISFCFDCFAIFKKARKTAKNEEGTVAFRKFFLSATVPFCPDLDIDSINRSNSYTFFEDYENPCIPHTIPVCKRPFLFLHKGHW